MSQGGVMIAVGVALMVAAAALLAALFAGLSTGGLDVILAVIGAIGAILVGWGVAKRGSERRTT